MHARIVDDGLDLLARGVEVLEGALRQARVEHQFLEGVRALRHVGGVLEQQGIASGQLRSQDAGDLVVGEIPRLDRQDHAQRLVHQQRVAFGRIGHRQFLRCQQGFGVLHVVLKDARGQLDLGQRFGGDLAHLQGQQPRMRLGILAQQVGGALQDRTALFERALAPGQEGFMGGADGLGDFGVGSVGEGLDDFAGVGVGGGVGHSYDSLQQ